MRSYLERVLTASPSKVTFPYITLDLHQRSIGLCVFSDDATVLYIFRFGSCNHLPQASKMQLFFCFAFELLAPKVTLSFIIIHNKVTQDVAFADTFTHLNNADLQGGPQKYHSNELLNMFLE